MYKTLFPNRHDIVRTANDIDRLLIEILRENGRAIGRDFADRTQLSEATISRRLAALEESQLVRVRGYVDLQDSGCNAASLIRFSTKDAPDSIAQALALRPHFYRVATVADQREIIALVAAANPSMLLEEIDAVLALHPDLGIGHCAAIVGIIPPFEARKKIDQTAKDSPGKLNTTRRSQVNADIIRTLQCDYRVTVTQIAEDAKLSSPSASAKLLEVIELGNIRQLVLVDPHFIARSICAQLRISVRGKIKKLAQKIGDTFKNDWVFLCLDREQILLEIAVADEVDLHRCQQEISKIAGVTSVACSQYSSVFKQDFDWKNGGLKSSAS